MSDNFMDAPVGFEAFVNTSPANFRSYMLGILRNRHQRKTPKADAIDQLQAEVAKLREENEKLRQASTAKKPWDEDAEATKLRATIAELQAENDRYKQQGTALLNSMVSPVSSLSDGSCGVASSSSSPEDFETGGESPNYESDASSSLVQQNENSRSALPSKTPATQQIAAPTVPTIHVDEMGPNFTSSIEKLGHTFTGLVRIVGLESVDPRQLGEQPAEDWDLRSVKYCHENQTCKIYLGDNKTGFQMPDFPVATADPSEAEMEEFIDRICNDPPKEQINYYVGPSLAHDNPRFDQLIRPGGLEQLPKLRQEKASERGADPRMYGDVPGVTSPYHHIGEPMSGTGLHCEDGNLQSANINLLGLKLWVLIDPKSTEKLETFIRTRYGGRRCDQWLRHLHLFVRPADLRKEKIEFKMVAARPGDMVVTGPRQYHMVVNMTASFAVAINFLLAGDPLFPERETQVCADCCFVFALEENLGNFKGVDECMPGEQQVASQDSHIKASRTRNKPTATNSATNLDRENTPAPGRLGTTNSATAVLRNKLPGNPKAVKRKPPDTHQAHNGQHRRYLPNDQLTKRQRNTPTIKELAEELTGHRAKERFGRYMLAFNNESSLELPAPWDDQVDFTSQVYSYIEKGGQYTESGAFRKLVGLIVTAYAVRRADMQSAEIGRRNMNRQLQQKYFGTVIKRMSQQAFWNWISRNRNLWSLGSGLLPYLPSDNEGMASFRDYERSSKAEVDQLKAELDKIPQVKEMEQAGEAFVDRILQRRKFVWQDIASKELEQLPIEALLSLVKVRRLEENETDKSWQPLPEYQWQRPDAVVQGAQCELCEADSCDCIRRCFAKAPSVVYFDGKELGLQAMAEVPGDMAYRKGTLIGEIVGRIVPPNTYNDGRAMNMVREDMDNEYVGQIWTGEEGNIFRFTNHKCANAEAEVKGKKISGAYRMVLVATQDILHGMEVCVDFGQKFDPCFCEICRSSVLRS